MLTTSPKVVLAVWPRMFVAVITTVWLWTPPSVVAYCQVQLPLLVPVLVTFPTEEEILTTSEASGSS